MMHLLVTRPDHQAASTAALLKSMGHVCTIEPLLRIEPTHEAQPTGIVDGIILTSSNGLPALQQSLPDAFRRTIPLLTTGRATARAAEAVGFHSVDFVIGSALDLIERAPAWLADNKLGRQARLIYPCAEVTARDLTELLSLSHIDCVTWPVYRTTSPARLSNSVETRLRAGKIDGVLLYSKRTAHTFVELMLQAEISIKGLRAFVLSREIYDALPEDLKANTEYPLQPDETALMQLVTE